MQQGRVQKFDELRGFGFILQGFKTRFYFHVANWLNDTVAPKPGMAVLFELAPGKKAGLADQAVNIVPLGSEIPKAGA